jgi:hypothetical protein
LPFLGWFISFVGSASLSVPFYFIWNSLAPIYFYQLPQVYLYLPFWHCVGLFIVIPIVKNTLTPTFVHVSQSNKNGEKNEEKNKEN